MKKAKFNILHYFLPHTRIENRNLIERASWPMFDLGRAVIYSLMVLPLNLIAGMVKGLIDAWRDAFHDILDD